MKFRDKRRVQSSIISYVPGEPAMQRHRRRLEFNLGAQSWVKEQAELMGLTLVVSNEGHHWRFVAESGFIAEWWPSSAKLVLNKQWRNGIHVHDYECAIEEIRKGMKSGETLRTRKTTAIKSESPKAKPKARKASKSRKPQKVTPKIRKIRASFKRNREEQEANGVVVAEGIRIDRHATPKIKHCWHCKTDKPKAEFKSPGATWCLACQLQVSA